MANTAEKCEDYEEEFGQEEVSSAFVEDVGEESVFASVVEDKPDPSVTTSFAVNKDHALVRTGGAVESRFILIIGPSGSGKSSVFRCITNLGKGPTTSLNDGTILNTSVETLEYYNNIQACFTVFDSVGTLGIRKHDEAAFTRLREDLGEEVAKISKVFICITAVRFNVADRALFSMLNDAVTEKFIEHVHIVVTHCPPYDQPTVANELKTKLNGFLPDLANKVTYIDLIDQRRFQGAAGRQVDREWAEARSTLLKIVFNTQGKIHLKEFLRPFNAKDFVRKFSVHILSAVIVVLVALLCALMFYHGRYEGKEQGKLEGAAEAVEKVSAMFNWGWLKLGGVVKDKLEKEGL